MSAVRRPIQAVILAGGRGNRLRPLTDLMPKPMIPFHGKPFLEYLVELLRNQGFERVLLLLGYLPSVVQQYFGDGKRWNIQIDYSITDVSHDTGRRLLLARPQIDPVFLLMYCDNYWPMDFDRMWTRFQSTGAPAQLTVYTNSDGYTRDNIEVGDDGVVLQYDRSRTAPGLRGVDIGFAILKRQLLDELPAENVSFEQVIYPQLVRRRELCAFRTSHRYYSVGSHDRLDLTRKFLSHQPAVIVDRDGVLNKKMPRGEYVRFWKDWQWLPGAKEAVALLKRAGYEVIVVSNQAGIARGVMSTNDLAEIHGRMKAEIREAGGEIDAIYFCPHGWDEGCECRKPRAGLLFAAQRDFSLDLSVTPFIGDDERDVQAAEAAGCPSLRVTEEMQLIDHAKCLTKL